MASWNPSTISYQGPKDKIPYVMITDQKKFNGEVDETINAISKSTCCEKCSVITSLAALGGFIWTMIDASHKEVNWIGIGLTVGGTFLLILVCLCIKAEKK